MSDQEHLCKRCGRCCEYKKLVVRDGELLMVRSGIQCEHMDKSSKLCLVYPTRFQKHPQCKTMTEAVAMRIMPNDCPYVADIEGYECAVEDYKEDK